MKKKTLRILGIILLFVVAIIFAFNSIIAKIIEKKIDAFLIKSHLEHYHIEYRRVGFNFLNRSVSLIDFKYLPDSIFLDSLDKSGLNASAMALSVGRISVSGIDFKQLIRDKKLTVRSIKIVRPEMKLYKFNGKLPPEKNEKKVPLKDSIRIAGLTGISISNISFKKSRLEIYNYKTKKFTLLSKDIGITLHGLQLDESGNGNDYFYPSLHDAGLIAKNNVIKLGNNLYEIKFKKLSVDLKGRTLIFQGFHYMPVYSKAAFSKHIKFQKERFEMQADEIAFTGAEFYRFLMENQVHIRKLTISNASIDLYRDKRVPFNHDQRPLLPNQTLKMTKGKLRIDTLQIKNTRFRYSEKTPSRKQTLQVWFTNLTGNITHITNFQHLWKKHNMELKLKGLLMDKAPLDIWFSFPLAAKSDTFYFSGGVHGPVSLAVFNPAIYPAAGLKFNSGVLDKITFKGGANPKYSSGTMTMLYHDMDFQAMKKKDTRATNKFLSWSVNAFVRKNNPRKGDNKVTKSVSMFFLRDIEKGFGNLFWKTLFSGMKATMIPSINNINKKNMQSVSETKAAKEKSK